MRFDCYGGLKITVIENGVVRFRKIKGNNGFSIYARCVFWSR